VFPPVRCLAERKHGEVQGVKGRREVKGRSEEGKEIEGEGGN
jgi:hypothetical protein